MIAKTIGGNEVILFHMGREYRPLHAKKVEYMAFPRLTAMAEVVWTPKDLKNYADYLGRLSQHVRRLQMLDVNFRPLDAPASGGPPAAVR